MRARRPLATTLVAAVLATLTGSNVIPATAETTDPELRVTRDVAYGVAQDEHGDPEPLRLDLYQRTDGAGAVRPAVIWVHGGGFAQGDKGEPANVAVATELARRGSVAVAVNYRLRPDVYPDYAVASVEAQHDVQAAVRWVRSNAAELGVDPARIAVAGFSAGAITAMRVGAYADDPGDSGTPGVPSDVAAVVAASGYLRADVASGAPPLLMVNGGVDPVVPVAWAEDTCARWQEAGSPCRLAVVEGASHDLSPQMAELVGLVERFFTCRMGVPIDFPDVRVTGRAAPAVSWVVAQGVARGFPDGTFRPHNSLTRTQLNLWLGELVGGPQFRAEARSRAPVTRAEAAMALWLAAGRPDEAPAAAFTDADPSAWYSAGIDWLAAHGIASGFRDGSFRPDEPVTRAQFANFLRNLASDPGSWAEPPDDPLCFEV